LVDRLAESYMKLLFGDSLRILFNETHQGLDGAGRMLPA
jgi:hypothetical protein